MLEAWDKESAQKFAQMIEKIPVFLRNIAKEKVATRALELAKQAGREHVTEQDMVDAFFKETPFGFHGPLKEDMKSLSIDFTQYGHTD